MHRLQELVRLHRMGTSARDIARLLRMGPNTERAYRETLERAGLLAGDPASIPDLDVLRDAIWKDKKPASTPKQEVSSIDNWRVQVEALMEKGLGPKAIFDRLRTEEPTFTGSYYATKRLCAALKKAKGVQAEDVAIPVESGPGEIAQVDFGYVGRLRDPTTGRLRPAWVFVMVLAFSRDMFAKVVFDQKTETWVELHIEAFRYFGGVVKIVVPDNLKAAVLRRAFAVDGDTELNRSYRELARHYNFKIDPTPPRAAKKKGKVESSVKYVKRNGLAGRAGERIDEVNVALSRWLQEIAGARIHGTTGKKPREQFYSVEQAVLQALPTKAYEIVVWKKATVRSDAHVPFDHRLFSVPWKLVNEEVWIRATPTTVAIYHADDRIATHRRRGEDLRSTIDEHLPEHRRDLRHRSPDYWEERANNIGPETLGLVKEIFDLDPVLSQLRRVQAIVLELERVPAPRAEAASKRARFFGTYTLAGMKTILEKGLDLEPLPTPILASNDGERPRFARSIHELIGLPLEVSDEPN